MNDSLEKALSIKTERSILTKIDHPLLRKHNIQLSVKRDDLLHPIISGNKWRKLKFILRDAIKSDQKNIISMGGAYSNHLHALAYVGVKLGLKTTGLIRGEDDQKNPTLNDLKKWGMNCEFVDRKTFRELRKFRLPNDAPAKEVNGYWIPEGGANNLALKGIAELVSEIGQGEISHGKIEQDEIDQDYDTITLACGTGTTLAGIARALPKNTNVIGFAALKGANFLNKEVEEMINFDRENVVENDQKNWSINLDYHFGGFGKTDQTLINFIQTFSDQTSLPIEPIYTGKMFYGLFDQIQQGAFKSGSKIIALHTGGLQGDRK